MNNASILCFQLLVNFFYIVVVNREALKSHSNLLYLACRCQPSNPFLHLVETYVLLSDMGGQDGIIPRPPA